MVYTKKKFSRKDMKKPDEFLKKSWELGEWMAEHRRQIIIVTVAVLVAILGVTFVWSFSQNLKIKSTRQMEEVFKATTKEIAPTQYTEGSEGVKDDTTFGSVFHKNEALLSAYKKARDNAKSAGVKKICTLGVATSLVGLERYSEALKEYETLLKDFSGIESLINLVYEGMGFAYEGLGKQDKALEQFKKLENCCSSAYKELAYYHQARIYEMKGEKDKSAALYKRIAENINKAEKFTSLFAYLQERISGREGVNLPSSMFGSAGSGKGPGELTPEMIEELKKKLEEMEKKQKTSPEEKAGGNGNKEQNENTNNRQQNNEEGRNE